MPDLKQVLNNTHSTSNLEEPPGKGKSRLGNLLAQQHATPVDPKYGGDITQGEDQNDYRFQLKSNADNNKLRAQDQGGWESAGIQLANLPFNIITGIGEMTGYIGSLVGEWGKDKDYSNELTELMKSAKNPFGEVYLENPEQTFDLTDSAWWITHIGGLVESASQFALPGALIGKGFMSLAKLAATAGRTTGQIASVAARAATASSLAYMEGAMSGYRVYEDAYNAQYRKLVESGLDPNVAANQAKTIAADAASTTVQMNTIMNTALNMTALAPMFRNAEDKALQFMKQNGKPMAGESADDFAVRMRKAYEEVAPSKLRSGITSYGSESLQEGLEEINTQYAEAEGKRVGEGQKKNLVESLTSFDRALSDVTNQEGALNFILGAFGGVAQTAIMDNIPMHRQIVDENVPMDGKRETKLVSSRTLQADGTRRYFDSLVKAVAADFDWKEKKMAELAQAKAAGDEVGMERIRMQLFDVLALNAVQVGMGENWISTFEEIASTDNTVPQTDTAAQLDELNLQMRETEDPVVREELQRQKEALILQEESKESEAMKKGLASNIDDNSYKQRAKEAIEDIKHYQKLHDTIYAKFTTPEEQTLGVADYLFQQSATVYRQKRLLQKGDAEIAKAEEEYDEVYGNSSYDADVWHAGANRAQEEIDMHQKIVDRISSDVQKFNDAITNKDAKTIDQILEKYKMVGHIGPEATIKALQKMMDSQIESSKKTMQKKAEDLLNSAGYQEYLKENPNTSLQDYVKFLATKYGKKSDLVAYKASLEELRSRIQANQANLNDIMSDSNNVKKLLKKIKGPIDEQRKKMIEEDRKVALQAQVTRNAAAAHVERNKTSLDKHKQKLEVELDATQKEIVQIKDRITAVIQKINALKLTEHSMWNLNWKTKMLKHKYDLSNLKSALNDLQQKELALHDALKLNSAEILAQQETNEQAAQAAQAATSTVPPPGTAPAPKTRKPAAKTGVSITPAARALAELNGLDINTIVPTGRNGKQIVKSDVEKALAASQTVTPPPVPIPEAPVEDEIDVLIKEQAEYLKVLEENIPAEAHSAFAAFEEALKRDPNLPDIDFRNLPETQQALDDGLFFIFSDEVMDTLTALRKYIKSLPTVQDDQETPGETHTDEGTKTGKPEKTETEVTHGPVVTDPEQPETDNAPDVVVGKDKSHYEAKAVSMLKVNTTTLNPVDYTDDKGNYRIAGVGLNPNLNPAILDPTQLKPGTKVTAELDKNYQGKGKVHGHANKLQDISFSDFTDPDGKVTDHMNVPIRLVDERGTVIGYLATGDWMMEQFPGTGGPERMRNIVETIELEDGTIIDNLAIQQERLSKLRRLISEAGTVQLTIEAKGPGRVILHVDNTGEKPKYTRMPATDMLPDTTLSLAVINQTVVNTARNNPIEVNNTIDELDRWHNAPVVVLPMANGSVTVSPLYMDKLENELDLRTVERAIWLYLKSKDADVQAELKDVFARTGYDFGNAAHLRRFITQQYTYLQSFDASHTAHNPEADNNNFLFNVTDPSTGLATVMIGFANSGQQPIVANLRNKELSPEFVEALRAGLATRYRNVNYTKDEVMGINNNQKFQEVLYQTSGWKVHKHANYNAYVKSHATTYVDGRNQLAGKYVYAANPMITFFDDATVILKEDQTVTATLIPEVTTPTTSDSEEFSADDLDAANEMLGMELNSNIDLVGHTVTSIVPSADMQPLSMKILKDLYTFTPSEVRNGKTPDQVYREMIKANIPYLADGHNPFLKCG
jgi:hypothetical protein